MKRYGRPVEEDDEEPSPPPLAELPLFRRDDPPTSQAAATTVRPQLGEIQLAVLAAYRQHGPMSARQAEGLPEFAAYGFSTVRKRVSELGAAGFLRPCGVERESGASPCVIYEVVP